jgi:hypothetical protein
MLLERLQVTLRLKDPCDLCGALSDLGSGRHVQSGQCYQSCNEACNCTDELQEDTVFTADVCCTWIMISTTRSAKTGDIGEVPDSDSEEEPWIGDGFSGLTGKDCCTAKLLFSSPCVLSVRPSPLDVIGSVVNVEVIVTEKAHQDNVKFSCYLDSKARRRSHCGDHRDTTHQSLLQ